MSTTPLDPLALLDDLMARRVNVQLQVVADFGEGFDGELAERGHFTQVLRRLQTTWVADAV